MIGAPTRKVNGFAVCRGGVLSDGILLKPLVIGVPGLEAYRQAGGFQALERVVREMRPADVVEIIRTAGLRGRGGAGFPTGRKWDIVARHRNPERYVVCNAGEHEPGTFKDRHLLNVNPFQLLEGLAIAAYAVGAKQSFLFMNGAFTDEIEIVRSALNQTIERGMLGDHLFGTHFNCRPEIFLGPDRYVAGEETAMLEAMQGRTPMPKHKPPFYPTEYGLWGKPTLVNNVETLSNIPHIVRNGAEWFRRVGTPVAPGTMLFSLSGDIQRSGVYELPLGTPLRALIEDCGGGVQSGRRIKAVYPGGPSFAFLTEKDLDVRLDFESLRAAGSGLGSAGVIVVDDSRCMVRKTLEFSRFFEKESCGQCPPCKMGTDYLRQIVERIENGNGEPGDLQSLKQLSGFVKGRGDCTLITGAAVTVEASLRHFVSEFEDHIARHRCPSIA